MILNAVQQTFTIKLFHEKLMILLQVAADLLLTGRLIDAKEAVTLGLAAKSSDDALETSLKIAR